jgi:hypothetical protein
MNDEITIVEKVRDGKLSKGVWVTLLIGGLFMTYGGIMNILEFFEISAPLAPPAWHIIDLRVVLILGIVNLIGAIYLIIKSFEIRLIINKEKKDTIKQPLIALLAVSILGVIVDLIVGYYARGYFVALLGLMYLCCLVDTKRKMLYIIFSLIFVALIILSFIYTGGY